MKPSDKAMISTYINSAIAAAVALYMSGNTDPNDLLVAAIVLGFVYGLLFVNQPLEQAPNDAAFIDLLSTVVVFLTGSLGGLLASNGMKKTKQTGATDETK